MTECPIGLDKKGAHPFCSAGVCDVCKAARVEEAGGQHLYDLRQSIKKIFSGDKPDVPPSYGTPVADLLSQMKEREAQKSWTLKDFPVSPLMTFPPHIPVPALSKNRCTHPNTPKVIFDLKDAQSMKTAREVRQKYPRLYQVCPDCGEASVNYASMDHYILGDW